MKNKTLLLVSAILALQLLVVPCADAGGRKMSEGRMSKIGKWIRKTDWKKVGRTAGDVAKEALRAIELAMGLVNKVRNAFGDEEDGLASALYRHDQDQDGALSRHELRQMVSQDPSRALDGFRFLDQDGDDRLELNEIRDALHQAKKAVEDWIEGEKI